MLNDLRDKLTVERIMVSKDKFHYYSPHGENKFDIMPIKENNKITKYWDKNTNQIFEIKQEHVISSNLDLISLVDCFTERPFYFIKHKEIIGLVNIPDLNKSPMRVLLFLLVAEIELSLKEILSKRIDEPLNYVSEDRKNKIILEKNNQKSKNVDLDIYEYLYIVDFLKILRKQEELLETLEISKSFIDNMEFIDNFRNGIAHPTRGIFKDNQQIDLKKLKSRIKRLLDFIEKLKNLD